MKVSLFIASPGMPDVPYVHLFRDALEKNVARAARLGFDGVELLIDDPDEFNSDLLAKSLKENGVALAAINSGRMSFQFGVTLLHPDEKIQSRAFCKLQAMVKIAGRFQCPVGIGLFRGKAIEGKPISYSRDLFVDILRAGCDFASSFSVGLNFEPTNRFETNFIHTTEEGLEIVERVGKPNLGLLLDLYHMYLEDKDLKESFRKARGVVRHIHLSDSDRWPAGVGHGVIDFPSIINLLKEIGYTGYLSEGLVSTEDVDASARQSVAYLKGLLRGA